MVKGFAQGFKSGSLFVLGLKPLMFWSVSYSLNVLLMCSNKIHVVLRSLLHIHLKVY